METKARFTHHPPLTHMGAKSWFTQKMVLSSRSLGLATSGWYNKTCLLIFGKATKLCNKEILKNWNK
jgi:hypothetical protein